MYNTSYLYDEDSRRPATVPPSAIAYAISASSAPAASAVRNFDKDKDKDTHTGAWPPQVAIARPLTEDTGTAAESHVPTVVNRANSGYSFNIVEEPDLERRQAEAYNANRDANRNASDTSEDGCLPFKAPPREIWVGIVIAAILNFGAYATLLYFYFSFVVLDDNNEIKPFQYLCLSYTDMTSNICLFSAGQITQGIICLGQVNIGVFSIGQVSIGLLFAVGQVAASLGYAPIGQLCTGWYVHIAQVGFGMYKVKHAQLGIQFIKVFFPDRGSDNAVLVTCG
jgi:hypothetical protein